MDNKLEIAGKPLEQVSREDLKFFPSAMLEVAYNSIDANTSQRRKAIKAKKLIVKEIWEKDFINLEILRQYTAVYFASGNDIEYPLCLGARKLMLVDPKFKYNTDVQEVINKINQITEEEVRVIEEEGNPIVEFQFDFGKGQEKVSVEFSPTFYAAKLVKESHKRATDLLGSGSDHGQQKYDTFNISEPIGLLMGFRSHGVRAEQAQNVVNQVVPGGYVLTDTQCDLMPLFSKGENSAYDKCSTQERREMEIDQYRKGGWEFINLKSFKGKIYTFLKKMTVE
ncbi:MAG: hypothetical protein U9Q63_02370 [Patescibacteria group bacterium]|nr:hypothetical protein [Patescibacteria group bacterium]